jgi:TolB-like protein/Tfp pilus assembly protein PilF
VNLGNFFAELKRRNVLRAAAFYAASAWLLVQVATQVFPFFHIAEWVVRGIVVAAAIGFPFAMVFSWFYEWTPHGIQRESEIAPSESATRQTGKKLDRWIIAILLLAVVLLLTNQFVLRRDEKPVAVAPDLGKSIAVLPFENFSDDKANAFFADGMHDDILTSLTKIAKLKVISRTSVMQYRGAGAARNLRDIAQALGVANILEGSVRRAGNRVLVSVQLIDASNDQHIWAERYDRTIADSIGLQGELAAEIARVLKAKLDPEEKTSLGTKPTSNPEAYVVYLRALEFEQNAETVEDLVAVDQLYAQAIALDPTFALAHARASISYSNEFWQTHDPALKAKARTIAEEALRLSPTLGEAHLALGLYFFLTELDYAASLEQFTIALTALPNNVEVLQYMAKIYRRQGRWREAIAGFEHARSLNPHPNPVDLVHTYWMVRDWRAAAVAMKRNLALMPDAPFPREGLAEIEVVANCNLAAARAKLREIPAGVDPEGLVTLANWNLSMLERDFATAEKWLADFPSDEFPDAYPKSFYQAQTALARGEVELARTLFEKVRPALESNVRDHPDDAGNHASLGILYGYMGRKEDAIRESRRAVELLPESTDAVNGVQRECNLALVYALTGEMDQALTVVERLLRTPGATTRGSFWDGGITQAELRLRWQWDKLRGNPRFQKILDGPEPKTIY